MGETEGRRGAERSSGKADIRTGRTQSMIQEAFLALLAEQEFDEIRVKDIADRAMVNRKTFYAHYENKQTLYDEMVYQIFEELCSSFMYKKEQPKSTLNPDLSRKDAEKFLLVMEKYRTEFLILVNPRFNYLWYPVLEAVIASKKECLMLRADTGREGEIPYKLYLDMITSQMVIWIYWWISQEEYTVEEGALFICRLMNRSMANVFRYVKPARVSGAG